MSITAVVPPISRRLKEALALGPKVIDLSGITAADPRVVAAIARVVTSARATGRLQDLTGMRETTIGNRRVVLKSRNSLTEGYLFAIRYLEQFYGGLKIAFKRSKYSVLGLRRPNLEAFFPADVPGAKTLLIGSHIDSTVGEPHTPEEEAPGCDDDCTGSVAAMMLAETLVELRNAGFSFGCNVRFVHFGSEEYRLSGSTHYAEQLAEEDIELIAMLQFEMMGYDGSKTRRVDLHDDGDKNGSHSVVESLVRSAVRYGCDLGIRDLHVFNPNRPSDHRPFLAKGFKAVCISEDSSTSGVNPHMHTTEDTLDKLDMPYYVDVARFLTGAVIDIATR